MPDGKRSSFEVPIADILGKCRYRIEKHANGNKSGCDRKSGSAIGGSVKCSATSRRVMSGSSISEDGRKTNNLYTEPGMTLIDQMKQNFVSGTKMFTDTGSNMCPVPNKIWRIPYQSKQTKENKTDTDGVRRRGKEVKDRMRGEQINDTGEIWKKSVETENSLKQDIGVKLKSRKRVKKGKGRTSSEQKSDERKTLKTSVENDDSSKHGVNGKWQNRQKEERSNPNALRVRSPIQLKTPEDTSQTQLTAVEENRKPQFSTGMPGFSKQHKDEPRLMSSPALSAPSRVTSAPVNKDRILSPIPFNSESGFADGSSDTSSRPLTSLSQSSNRSTLSVTINTNTPISAWSDYTVPDEMEMRERLLRGRFGAQFQNYNPYVLRKKMLYNPTPTEDEDYDTDLEDGGFDLVAVERARQRKEDSPFPDYNNLCRTLGSVPNSYFLRHALDDDLDMRFRYPGINDTKALATEIKNDATVSKLDLTDNGLGPSQLVSLAEMLHNDTTITHINLSENKIGPAGARILRCVLRSESRLYSLNLAGNKLGDKGAHYIVSGLERNVFLKELNLSHNEIGELGMKYLCPFLGGNVTLDVLDLSWNHIRKQGALMLAKAVKVNQQLSVLRVSMNGLHVDGAQALGSALEENSTLLELDISANRIPRSGARALAAGLAANTELRRLKVGFNPLSPGGAKAILDAVDSRDNTEGIVVDFEGVYVSQDFESQALDLMEDSKVKILFSLEPSRRGRSRELLSSYIHSLQLLLRELNIDVNNVYSDVTEDNVITSGNDVIHRLMKSNCLRDKMDRAQMNHFIYSYGNRKFLIRDWRKKPQNTQSDGLEDNWQCRLSPSATSGTPDSRQSQSSHWLKGVVGRQEFETPSVESTSTVT